MCTAQLFLQGVNRSALKFYADRFVSSNHSWRQKTRKIGLPDEDRIPLHSLILILYRSVTDRRMEHCKNQIDYSYGTVTWQTD